MKNSIILIPVFCLTILLINSRKGICYSGINIEFQEKVDSFYYHYKILDSIVNRNPYDTSYEGLKSLEFMERVTGIKAHPAGDYIGWVRFNKNDLVIWKGWELKQGKNCRHKKKMKE